MSPRNVRVVKFRFVENPKWRISPHNWKTEILSNLHQVCQAAVLEDNPDRYHVIEITAG